MKTKSFFAGVIISVSVITLYMVYRAGIIFGTVLYLSVLFFILAFFFVSRNSRVVLVRNLAKFARNINARFDDNGGLFIGEGRYCQLPVGFKESNFRGKSSLEVYCKPEKLSGSFEGEFVSPTRNTVLRAGLVSLGGASGIFSKKELSDNDIIDILEELRKAARVAETGTMPYKQVRARKIIGTLAVLAAVLFLSCLLLLFKLLHR